MLINLKDISLRTDEDAPTLNLIQGLGLFPHRWGMTGSRLRPKDLINDYDRNPATKMNRNLMN
jgi:hypothetical protein